MARTRLTLHEELCEVLGTRNCYFSPPSTVKMTYPCIRYIRENEDVVSADNLDYLCKVVWSVTVIDTDPDSEIPSRLKSHFAHYCRKDREYTADGLYHFVYTLYY